MEPDTFQEFDHSADILVIDDDVTTIHLFQAILEKIGYLVRSAESATEALKSMEGFLPDLILLDIKMDDMDGFELCELLQCDPSTRDIPVVFISSLADPQDKVRAFKAGGVDYIVKPFYKDELLSRVRTHVNLRLMRKRLEQQVKKRTLSLEQRSAELEETIAALRVLMEQYKNHAKETEQTVLFNITKLIQPIIDRLQRAHMSAQQKTLVNVLETNIQEITSPLLQTHSGIYLKLTPTELQIVNLVKQDKRSKEIADILNLSQLTISTHRKNIRKKLGITHQKVNLRTFLTTC